MATSADRLEGELTGFSFQAPDGGFAVARVRGDDGREVIVVGPIAHVHKGQHVVLGGRWATHPTFGRQFKADRVLIEDPRTISGLERYLASGAVQGLGPTFARRVVEAFGLRTLDIIENHPERLRDVPGIGKKRVEQIVAHWERDQAHREIHAALRGHGIGQALANRIIETYGKDTLGVLTREPYRLAAEVAGVGFRTADRIALEVGVSRDDPARAEAAAVYTLREAEGQGHCFLPEDALRDRMGRLDVPSERTASALDRLVLQGMAVRHPTGAAARPVYLPELERAEAFISERLADLVAGCPPTRRTPDVGSAEAKLGLALNGDQRRAVATALSGGVTVITGGPGTGKTTIVRVLLQAAGRLRQSWLLAAPTGRAAQRLSETTGREAKTLHRLLEYNPHNGGFQRGPLQPLECDGVLVDEASMVDVRLMASLLSALPDGCRLVMVGDADQLPSVGPGRVLGELVASGAVPVATLSEVYRQAAGSGIVRNAWRVNGGEVPVSGEREPAPDGRSPDFYVVERGDPLAAQATALEILTRRLPKLGFDPRQDVQVLTPMHAGPLGTVAMNERIQALLNPDAEVLTRGNRRFSVGDRVIQVRNDYDNDIFNGDTGTVLDIAGGRLTVDFDGRPVTLTGEQLRDVELAWCISIHKSQGSEYPAVLVLLHRSHRIMLRRNLLYTAMTRARRFCCVVADPWALRTAVQTRGGDERWTRLAERLMQPAHD